LLVCWSSCDSTLVVIVIVIVVVIVVFVESGEGQVNVRCNCPGNGQATAHLGGRLRREMEPAARGDDSTTLD